MRKDSSLQEEGSNHGEQDEHGNTELKVPEGLFISKLPQYMVKILDFRKKKMRRNGAEKGLCREETMRNETFIALQADYSVFV